MVTEIQRFLTAAASGTKAKTGGTTPGVVSMMMLPGHWRFIVSSSLFHAGGTGVDPLDVRRPAMPSAAFALDASADKVRTKRSGDACGAGAIVSAGAGVCMSATIRSGRG